MRRSLAFALLLALAASTAAFAADTSATSLKPGEPTNAKARKSWDNALEWERRHAYSLAVKEYRKANEQDGGHCILCLNRALSSH